MPFVSHVRYFAECFCQPASVVLQAPNMERVRFFDKRNLLSHPFCDPEHFCCWRFLSLFPRRLRARLGPVL